MLSLFSLLILSFFFFFFHDTATTEIYTLSLHDALPISATLSRQSFLCWIKLCSLSRRTSRTTASVPRCAMRSEEHTSELQSRFDLVCRLLLEKKKKIRNNLQNRHHTN